MKTVSALSLVMLALSSASLSAASLTPVMIGLDNPRGLAFGPEGALYVVEAGSGGTDSCALLRGLARGPDGAYYVGELTGAPFAPGAARVYRVVAGSAPEIFLEGFKTIIDLDFGPAGSLHVLQHATGPVLFPGPGQVIQVAPNGNLSVVVEGLTFPTAVLAAPDGSLYISNRGTSVLTGEVLHAVF